MGPVHLKGGRESAGEVSTDGQTQKGEDSQPSPTPKHFPPASPVQGGESWKVKGVTK